jgi:diaminopimelate decarboxylase
MKRPFFTYEEIKEICQKYPTPFYIYDEEGIRQGIRNLQKAFSWNKNFKEYYAVKACPNPTLLRIIKEEGCGLDCSSYTELMLAEAIGCTGDDIMFSSNVTPAEDYVYARELDSIINLDDFTHIEFLEEHAGLPKRICLRYNPGGEMMIGNTIMGNPGDAKYGMTKEQLIQGIKILMSKGVEEFGIHAFLASNVLDNNYYVKLAEMLFELVVEINNITGANFTFVNLSGGIGIPYRPGEKCADLMYIGKGVKEAFERIIKPSNVSDDLAIKTELGRYITGPHGILVTKAIHHKDIYKNYIGVDACAANLLRPAMYGAYHHITVMGKEEEPNTHVYDITGGLCENNDKFAVDRAMPEIETGDILAIHDAGAHGFAMGYNYNGKLRSAEILLKTDRTTQLIRRAETPMDYFQTLDFDEDLSRIIEKRK